MAIPLLAPLLRGVMVAIQKDVEKQAQKKLAEMAQNMLDDSKKSPEDSAKDVLKLIRSHISKRFPNSKHWNPNKVVRNGAKVIINIAGANRAYQNIDIYPKKSEYLTIPLQRFLKGVPAKSIDGLFKPTGCNILAKNEKGSLVAYYALSRHVHQNRDSTLLPSEEEIAKVAEKGASAKIDNRK